MPAERPDRIPTHDQVDLVAALTQLRRVITDVPVDLLSGGRMAPHRWHGLADILTEAARLCREQGDPKGSEKD